jgi:uncharacterized small protein (DUF1192 family)
MGPDDDGKAKASVTHEIGQDLSALSLHELDARVALLKAEIERLAAARAAKEAAMGAAAGLFKL